MSEKLGRVYCLKDPDTLEVRYVGFTVGTIKRRYSQHLYEARKQLERTSYKLNWVRNLLKNSKQPVITLLEDNIPYNLWEEKENYWINQFTSLTNYRKGGVGIVINRSSTSKQRSANSKKIKVVQFNLKGEYLKTWDSAADAVNTLKLIGLTREGIGRCCKKKYMTSGNYMWAYEIDYKIGYIPIYKTHSEIHLALTSPFAKPIYVFCCYTRKFLFKLKSGQDFKRKMVNEGVIKNLKSNLTDYINSKRVFKKRYFLSHTSYLTPNQVSPSIYYFNNKYFLNKMKIAQYLNIEPQNFYKILYKYNIGIVTNFNEDIVQSLVERLKENSYVDFVTT